MTSGRISRFRALFTAVFLFSVGSGLLHTQLSLCMTLQDFSTMITGMIQAFYFMGLFCGYFLCGRLILRVGHVRSLSAFAGLGTTLVLLHSLYVSPYLWAILRFFTGIIVFGLFAVIESWLNACSEKDYRGRTLSIYMILNYIALGIGQQFLNIGNVQGQMLFTLAALLISLSSVPVLMSGSVLPESKASSSTTPDF